MHTYAIYNNTNKVDTYHRNTLESIQGKQEG